MTVALIRHSRVLAVLHQDDALHFQFKAIQQHGLNVLSFQASSRGIWWIIVGCYLDPGGATNIERVINYTTSFPCGSALLLSGYFDTNLTTPEGSSRREYIMAAIAAARLEDMSTHFFLCRKPWLWYRGTCCMLCLEREGRSQTNYIMVTDSRLLRNVSVQDPWRNSDHFMVMVCIRGAAQWEHTSYLGRRCWFPLLPPRQHTQEDQ